MVPKIAPIENICNEAYICWHLIHNKNIIFHSSFHQSRKSLINAPGVWVELKWVSFPYSLNYKKNVHNGFRHRVTEYILRTFPCNNIIPKPLTLRIELSPIKIASFLYLWKFSNLFISKHMWFVHPKSIIQSFEKVWDLE